MTSHQFNAVIFDLDVVITKTALVHSAAWKKMFDDYLMEREAKYGEPFREFSHETDYLPYVDGKPRYKGVESFLLSRDINIPYGSPDNPSEMETVCGLGNRKNSAFNLILEEQGVETYEGTVRLIHDLKKEGIRVGVASSSKNCETVLRAAGLLDIMETRVDGIVSDQLKLKGKPEADIFTTAADNLGCAYDKAVVVEDAVSGVQAGRAGNFGLVIGVAREGNGHELKVNGADIVVNDLGEINIGEIDKWFDEGLHEDNWSISFHDFDPLKEKTREALLAVGNGYFGTRGALEESVAGRNHYPGTYMAGVYNRLTSKVAGRDIENEDLVNCINWLPVGMRIGNGDWIDIDRVKTEDIRRTLHFDTGVLWKRMIIRDGKGRQTLIESRRIASMAEPNLAALEYVVTPLNYSEQLTIRSGLSANHINDGVDRYRQLSQVHIMPAEESSKGSDCYLGVRTTTSGIDIAAACRSTWYLDDKVLTEGIGNLTGRATAFTTMSRRLEQGESLTLNKVVAMAHSLDRKAGGNPGESVIEMAAKYTTFDEVLKTSADAWQGIWSKADIKLEGDRLAQKLLRMHIYHLMVTISPNNKDIDAGIPARGLHGEAYRGHIFWDELYILPFYDIHLPDVARSVLMYRYLRLDAARRYAQDHGYEGAMFPWQSGSDGREETQVIHLNPLTGEWGPDHSSLQRHVSLAIAYNTWQYYHVTGDREFMESYGAELFLEICRFWVSKSHIDPASGKYSIDKVMGPDEFHEKYPDSEEGGLKDNAYTNIMVAWCLDKAMMLLEQPDTPRLKKVRDRIGLGEDETEKWKKVMNGLRIVISEEGIIAQYDGYFELSELDWDEYRKKYGNIYRMDRLLKADGKSPDDYKVAKQADTLMVFYNLDRQEVDDVLQRLGYDLPSDYIAKNLAYYLARTSHGSTLSRVVHAHLANIIGDQQLGWTLYRDALTSDYQDIQGGTTAEGIHAGVMAGTVWIALTTFGGLNLKGEFPAFDPHMPPSWRKLSYRFSFRGDDYACEITHKGLRICVEKQTPGPSGISWKGQVFEITPGKWHELT